MSTKTLVIPIDAEIKEQVKYILAELGLNQSQVVNALFREIARTKRVPLSFDLNQKSSNLTQIEQKILDEYYANPISLSQIESDNLRSKVKQYAQD